MTGEGGKLLKKRHFKATCIMVLTFILLIPNLKNNVKAQTQTSSRLDVVFVLDASISMKNSDPQNLRYEAIKLYMDMGSAKGNRIGIVAYGGELTGEKALTDISSEESRNEITQYLTSLNLVSYTDTGIGLKRALEVLEASGNEEGAKKALILLSDGKNEPKRASEQCTTDTNSALEYAKGKGYPIYTIGLNADGTVDSKLLNSLSSNTGGKSYITSKASDLNSILQEIYTENTTSKIIDTGTSEGSDKVSAPIQVPNDSVEEATITVLHTQPISMTLNDPSGAAVALPSGTASLSESSTYSLIKLSNPSQGTWTLNVDSPTGEKLTVNYVLSYKLKAVIDIKSPDNVNKGDAVELTMYLTSNGSRVDNADVYKDLEAKVSVFDSKGELIKQITLAKDEAGSSFRGSYSLENAGSFRIQGQLQGKIFYSATEMMDLTLKNNPPAYTGKLKKIKIIMGNEKLVNLEELFSDPDLDTLTYTASSDIQGLDIELSGSQLALKGDSKLEGNITFTADDGNGGIVSQAIAFAVVEGGFITDVLTRLQGLTTMQLVIALAPIAAVILIIILISITSKRKRKKKSTKGGIILKGQIMLNVVDNTTGEVFPPQFLKLRNYTKGVTIFNLLSSLPEYSETSKIKLFASVDNVISIKNDSDCIITKNKVREENRKWLELNPNDVAEIKLVKLQRSILIKYLP